MCVWSVAAWAESIPIRLVVNPWPASALNVEVAKQLLKTQLGREAVAIEVDERAQWALLASGGADASLELWPSGHREAWKVHVEEKRDVVAGGPLGVCGQIGWYVPRAVVTKDPALASWQGLRNGMGHASIFAQEGTRGRLLTGDPSWTQFDAEIVTNLGLELDVVSLGSEAALVAEVRRSVAAGKPVLFYFYTPHALFQELDLTMVELPPHDPEQWKKAGQGGAACSYPAEPLMKIFSATLAERDAGAEAFLRAMHYDNAAQVEMLAAIEAGRTPTEAAAAWVQAHPETWKPWVKAAHAAVIKVESGENSVPSRRRVMISR